MPNQVIANEREYSDKDFNAVTAKGGLGNGGHLEKQEPTLAMNMFQMLIDVMIESSNAASTTANSSHAIVEVGSIVLDIDGAERFFYNGQDIKVIYDPENWMAGVITNYDQPNQQITVSLYAKKGGGTYANWLILAIGVRGVQGVVPGVYAGKAVAPGSNNDSNSGFMVGDMWIDEAADESYRCVDTTVGAAVWVNTSMEIGDLGSFAFLNENATIKANRPTVPVTATKTLAISDADTLQYNTAGGANTTTIPLNAVAIPINSEIEFFIDAAQEMTLTAVAGVIVNGVDGGSIVIEPNNSGVLKKVATNRWIYSGQNQTSWAV